MVINALDLSSLLGQLGFKKGRGLQNLQKNGIGKQNFCFLKIIFKKCYLSFRVFQNTSFDNALIYTYSTYRQAISLSLSFFLLSPEAAKDPPETCIQMAPKKDKRG